MSSVASRLGEPGREAEESSITTWKGGISMAARAATEVGMQSRMADAVVATCADVEAAGWGGSDETAIVHQRLAARA